MEKTEYESRLLKQSQEIEELSAKLGRIQARNDVLIKDNTDLLDQLNQFAENSVADLLNVVGLS